GRGDLSHLVFEKSARTLFALGRGNTNLLQGARTARVEPLSDGGLVRLTQSDASGYVALKRFPLAPDGDLLARVELDAEDAGDLLLLPIWEGETEPRRKQYASSRFRAGANTLYLRVPRTPKLEGLALRWTQARGPIVLRSLEVRAMPGE
ncbi:MAG: hypothetical protein IPJ77_20625, partial [Planctomycetes bacterium]|nr:hypothetical protein [Planctomycetota bacterium]